MSATAITIGTFDGVHVGHQSLVARARARASHVIALCFDPHPATMLRPASVPPRLSTFEQRSEKLRAAGADEVVRLSPTADLLDLSPFEFVERIVKKYAPSLVIEGQDFRFGKGRAGDVNMLSSLGEAFGFEVEIAEPVDVTLTDHHVVRASSSLVRWLLSNARVADATIVLGRSYELTGTVVRGDQKGRTINCPTANLASDCLAPADGVYAAFADLGGGRRFPTALSVGTRPTFDGLDRRIEAHLLDFDPSILPAEYGWTLSIKLVAWIREQVRFHSIDALRDQIARDCHRAREFLNPASLPVSIATRASTCA